ncbi:MAG: hypothetical protein JO337_00370 [Acidimicrobiales bacterium]|nr:hypothetical protein [Acidimicrobiales bacterium]
MNRLVAGVAAVVVMMASAASCRSVSPVPGGSTGTARSPQNDSGLVTARGPGWTRAGLDGPVPATAGCTYRHAVGGYNLPDPQCTPGAIDPRVTQADIDSTVCRPGGYTASVRPPEAMTNAYKRLAEAAYSDPAPPSSMELDHLVPLELGGASDTRNLWPEPDQGRPAQFDSRAPFGINAKDGVEGRLHDAVCAGQVTLAAAQAAIASDWPTAEARLGLSP